jgi:hypothetical protein
MEYGQTSCDLLAHFDGPTNAVWPDAVPRIPTRGIRWVLQWATALAVLTIAGSSLTEFAYLLAAEHRLALAARAGVLEATLPRSSYERVTSTVERQLNVYPHLARQLQLSLLQNGSPAPRRIRQNDGDRFSIRLAVPASAIVPDWLRAVLFWHTDSQIEARVERQVPARKLP